MRWVGHELAEGIYTDSTTRDDHPNRARTESEILESGQYHRPRRLRHHFQMLECSCHRPHDLAIGYRHDAVEQDPVDLPRQWRRCCVPQTIGYGVPTRDLRERIATIRA